MALVNRDRVLETSTTTGTGTYTLAGAVTGFQDFSVIGNGNTCHYAAWEVDGSGNPSGGWETGLGTYTASGTTMARTTVYASSNSGSAVNWAAGTRRIACAPLTSGTFIVRQPGGTAGTDEIQVSHDGTNGTVECKDGYLQLISATKRVAIPTSNNFTILLAFGGGGAGLTSRSEGNVIGVTVGNTSTIDFNANQTVSRVPFCISTDPGTSAPDVGFGRASAGVWSFTSGASSTTGRTFSSPVLTPSQITANQDNYAPGVAMHYRLSSDASRDITGLSVGQVDGQVCEIWNIGSNNIVLKHDVTSTAANRFLCVGSADLTLLPNDIALLRYDPTSQRWRVGKL